MRVAATIGLPSNAAGEEYFTFAEFKILEYRRMKAAGSATPDTVNFRLCFPPELRGESKIPVQNQEEVTYPWQVSYLNPQYVPKSKLLPPYSLLVASVTARKMLKSGQKHAQVDHIINLKSRRQK